MVPDSPLITLPGADCALKKEHRFQRTGTPLISGSFLKVMYRKIIRICDPAEKDKDQNSFTNGTDSGYQRT